MMALADIRPGHVYAASKQRRQRQLVDGECVWNDRRVDHVRTSTRTVVWASPNSLRKGHLAQTDFREFMYWADRDVTDEREPGRKWIAAPWTAHQRRRQAAIEARQAEED